jgi:hypothetical protein
MLRYAKSSSVPLATKDGLKLNSLSDLKLYMFVSQHSIMVMSATNAARTGQDPTQPQQPPPPPSQVKLGFVGFKLQMKERGNRNAQIELFLQCLSRMLLSCRLFRVRRLKWKSRRSV